MHDIPLSGFRSGLRAKQREHFRPMDREAQKGQVLIEGLILMLFLVSVLVVFMNFTKKQNEVFKKYELPAKIKFQHR